MLITVTTTSQTLEQMLSAEDFARLRGWYTDKTGGILRNGDNRVYIETGTVASELSSFYIEPSEVLSFAFIRDIYTTQFKTASGSSSIRILF